MGCACFQSRLENLGNDLLVSSSKSDFEGFGETETLQGDCLPSYPTLACKNLVRGDLQQCQKQYSTSINNLAGHRPRESSSSGVPSKSYIVDPPQPLTGLDFVSPDLTTASQTGQSSQTTLPEVGNSPVVRDRENIS